MEMPSCSWDFFSFFCQDDYDAEEYSPSDLSCPCHSFQCFGKKKVVISMQWMYAVKILTTILQ